MLKVADVDDQAADAAVKLQQVSDQLADLTSRYRAIQVENSNLRHQLGIVAGLHEREDATSVAAEAASSRTSLSASSTETASQFDFGVENDRTSAVCLPCQNQASSTRTQSSSCLLYTSDAADE